jgi:hypothetical protein
VLTDFLGKGATMNSECYIETQKILKKCITTKGAEMDDVLLQQGNARPHTGVTTTDAIAHLRVYSATPSSLQPRSHCYTFPVVSQTLGKPQGPKLQL